MAGKDNVSDRVADIIADTGIKPKKKKAKKDSTTNILIEGSVSGDVISTENMTKIEGGVYINERRTVKNVVDYGPESITGAHKVTIRELIRKIVKKEAAAGLTTQQAWSKWYSNLQLRFGFNTIAEAKDVDFEDMCTWLRRQGAIKRSKIRRRDNTAWRNELYAAIYARLRELGFKKPYAYRLAEVHLDKPITSLKDLGERDLKRLYDVVMRLKSG